LEELEELECFEQLEELGGALYNALKPCLKPLLAFFQIVGSFKDSLTASWSSGADSISRGFSVFNLDLFNLDSVRTTVLALANFVNTQMVFFSAVAAALAGCAAGSWFISRECGQKRSRPEADEVHKTHMRESRHGLFEDRLVGAVVFALFLLYPRLCSSLLKLYATRTFGKFTVLAAEWGLDANSLSAYRVVGGFFIILYMFGIPLFFFRALSLTAKPKPAPTAEEMAQPLEIIRQHEIQHHRERRYKFLYDVYEPHQWWWELEELFRKLTLTGLIIFIAPGTTTQIFISAVIALCFLLLCTFFNPFKSESLDILNFVSQFSSICTLLLLLAIRADLKADGFLTQGFEDSSLVLCALAPPVTTLGIGAYSVLQQWRKRRVANAKMRALPAILRSDRPPNAPSSGVEQLPVAPRPRLEPLELEAHANEAGDAYCEQVQSAAGQPLTTTTQLGQGAKQRAAQQPPPKPSASFIHVSDLQSRAAATGGEGSVGSPPAEVSEGSQWLAAMHSVAARRDARSYVSDV